VATRDHLYTTSAKERDAAIASAGYVSEGVACHVFAVKRTASTPLFRLYNPGSGDHFYTTNARERDVAIASAGYVNEGVACYVHSTKRPKTTPFFRLYNASSGDHFYTTRAKDRDAAIASAGYVNEKIACHVYGTKQAGTTPLYRLRQPQPQPVVHVAPSSPVPLGGDYWQGGYDIERDEASPVWGFADLHAHPLAHLGFGGHLIAGRPDGPMEQALAWCTGLHGPGGTGLFVGKDVVSALLRGSIEGGFGHLVGGYPEFDGWPRFTSLIHQKMYVDWVRRAYDGGLRLMVGHAVNNALLAAASGSSDTDDRRAVEMQVQATKDLVARHSDFMEVAYSSSDARRIIGENKLAVVLGVEVDSLGGWGHEGELTDDGARAYMRQLYQDLGVRHIFPIHLANNAFGGTAVYADLFNYLNAYLRGEFFDVRLADVDFELADINLDARPLLPASLKKEYPHGAGGHENAVGLTARGRAVVQECMRLGMIIDIDHMSERAVDETLNLAETAGYPVVAGHTAFRDLAVDGDRNEYQRTPTHIGRIGALGGMLAVGLYQHAVKDAGIAAANDAPGTAKSWAQAYMYAARALRPRGVGIGTDINGLSGHAGPRFGMSACHGIKREDGETADRTRLREQFVYAQTNGVRYASPISDYREYRWEGFLHGDVYNDDDKDAWESIAIFKAGLNPDDADAPPFRNAWRTGKIKNVAKGLRASSPDQLENPFLGGNTFNEQKAGYLIAHGLRPGPNDDPEITRLWGITKRIWDRWHAMEGTNVPLTRNTAGRRDFDINIDGVAHYGLLPDFLQDVRNVGLTQADLGSLFRSAEEYIRTWERCERQRVGA
jgi:microsomal dipeptidase-like Zn-dependent dipeptidase